MVSYGDIMPQDDWIRFTLRLPPQLHARLTEIAEKNASSLNGQIITTLFNAVGGDIWAKTLASLSAEEFLAEMDTMAAEYKRSLAEHVQIKEAIEAVTNKILATLPDEGTPPAVKPKWPPPAANLDLPPDYPTLDKPARSTERKHRQGGC